jgi:threonine dehydratase
MHGPDVTVRSVVVRSATDSVDEMMRHVEAPSALQLEAATRVIADHLEPTPTVTLRLRGRPVLAKLESLQITGSFKIRGALAAIDAAHRDDPHGAVITSSAGNHGLGIAHASNILRVPATVVVPANASAAKVKKLRNYDIELIQYGSSYDEAQAHAMELAETRAIRYISPFNDTNVIAGQATVFAEMLSQAPEIEHVVVPVGGGGLVAGVLLARAAHGRDDVRVTGVQPEASAAMYHVLRGSAMDSVRHRPTIADGLAGGGDEGAVTNELIADHNVALVLVDEHHIRQGVREAAESSGLVLEGSAATPYAAIVRGLVEDDSRLGFIASGRNIAHGLLVELLSEPLD